MRLPCVLRPNHLHTAKGTNIKTSLNKHNQMLFINLRSLMVDHDVDVLMLMMGASLPVKLPQMLEALGEQ